MSDPEQHELTDDQRLATDNFWKYHEAWKALRAVNMALYQDTPNRSVPEDTEVLFSQCMERIGALRGSHKEQGDKTASEEPPTRLYLSAYQGQFFDGDVEYVRLESIAELLEARAAQFSRPSVAAHELERMAREIRNGAHHEGEE